MSENLKSIGEIVAENTSLHDEALAWHKRASDLEIENIKLRERISILAIENVRLRNLTQENRTKPYDEDL